MTEPTLVYDDDCGFCSWWAAYFTERSDVPLVGFAELDEHPELRARLPADYEACSHFVTDEAVYSCGASIEEAFRRSDRCRLLDGPIRFFRHFEDYNALREWGYRFVANRRALFGRLLTAPAPTGRDDESA